MGVNAAIFESAGKISEHYVPGVYTRSHNVTSAAGVSSGNLCVMGLSNGGVPDTLLEFRTLAEAKETLVGGELLDAVGYAFNGSDEFIPQRVFALRVNQGTQSELTLKSSDTEVVKLKSWDYGTHTNQLCANVESGAAENSKVVNFTYKDQTVSTGEISRPSLEISYTGEGTSASVSVNVDSLVLTEVIDGEPTTLEFKFADYDTIGTLEKRINNTDTFVATVLDTNVDAKSAELDTASGIDITSTETILYSNFAAFIEAVKKIPFIGDVEVLATSRIVPDDSDIPEYFSGATNGKNGQSTEWMKALEVLETEDIQIIAVASTNTAINALIANHVTSMNSTENRRERTAFLGAPIGETDDEAIANAVAFNSKYISYVIDSAIAANPITGKTETITGAMVGVMLAGIESAMSVNEPLTNKALKVLGFSKTRNVTGLEKLIKKGIITCNPSPQNMTDYVCIRAVTTYQGNDLIPCERSMVREDLFMNKDFRAKFDSGIGRPALTSPATVIRTLRDAAAEWASRGYIVPNDSNENVWNIRISESGDKYLITYSRYLTAPTNFIFATATNEVYTSTMEL